MRHGGISAHPPPPPLPPIPGAPPEPASGTGLSTSAGRSGPASITITLPPAPPPPEPPEALPPEPPEELPPDPPTPAPPPPVPPAPPPAPPVDPIPSGVAAMRASTSESGETESEPGPTSSLKGAAARSSTTSRPPSTSRSEGFGPPCLSFEVPASPSIPRLPSTRGWGVKVQVLWIRTPRIQPQWRNLATRVITRNLSRCAGGANVAFVLQVLAACRRTEEVFALPPSKLCAGRSRW
jgi:hypothetical protein